MAWTKFLGGPLWFQWARTIVFTLLFAEYLRLVITADAVSYRIVIMVVWGVIAAVSAVALVREIRESAGPHDD